MVTTDENRVGPTLLRRLNRDKSQQTNELQFKPIIRTFKVTLSVIILISKYI